MVHALIQLEGAFGGMSFVPFRGHIVETCSVPICLIFCENILEQLILLSPNPSVNPISPIVKTLCEAFFARMKHISSQFDYMETD
jgi:hypothetical protein